jgi:hypothetical protein
MFIDEILGHWADILELMLAVLLERKAELVTY